MSSKVLRGAQQTTTGPMQWRSASETRDQKPSAKSPQAADDAAASARQVEVRVEEARQIGYREGAAGTLGAVQPVLERLAHSIDVVAGLRTRIRREAESDLVKLSIAIARRILHREISVDPEAISGLMKAALEKVQSQEIHRIRVHPDLEAAVRKALESLASGRGVQVVADGGRESGDVVFETTRGNLDASIDTQLQEISRGLADRLRGKS
ncbi:MAG: FliH/SctL family protein [Bryobacterales bacterium]|nr:FliH/SctL family protein [Bryobacterales bacterium]